MTRSRDPVLSVRIVATTAQAPHEIWQIWCAPQEGTVRLFYDRAEAERVMSRMLPGMWVLESEFAQTQNLAALNAACASEGLTERRIFDETGELLATAWGSAAVLERVEKAENFKPEPVAGDDR